MIEYFMWVSSNLSSELDNRLRKNFGIHAKIYPVEGADKFVFASDSALKQATSLLDYIHKEKNRPAPAPSKCKLTIENSGPKVVQGLRNLTKGAWHIFDVSDNNRIMWVSHSLTGYGSGRVDGCQIFYRDKNCVDSVFDMAGWDSKKFEYLGDNLKIEFKV